MEALGRSPGKRDRPIEIPIVRADFTKPFSPGPDYCAQFAAVANGGPWFEGRPEPVPEAKEISETASRFVAYGRCMRNPVTVTKLKFDGTAKPDWSGEIVDAIGDRWLVVYHPDTGHHTRPATVRLA